MQTSSIVNIADAPLEFPKPLKPKFRYLKQRERLTTVMAVKCRDGVILCADGQLTSNLGILGTKDTVSKIQPVNFHDETDNLCVLGCSGVEPYIDLFRQHVGREMIERGHEGRSYFEALDRAIQNYSRYVKPRTKRAVIPFKPEVFYPSAIFAGYEPKDKKIRVYLLETPHSPNELSIPYRSAIGSGGLYASLLLNIVEVALDRMRLVWTDLSTKLVAQICYMTLGRIVNYDVYSWYERNGLPSKRDRIQYAC